MGAQKISWLALLSYSLILSIPLLVFYFLRIKKSRSLIIAVLRMAVQLGLVAFYLETIFRINHPLLNLLWLIVMLLVASGSVINQSGLQIKAFFVRLFAAFMLSLALILFSFLIIFDLQTLLSARYIIPLGGMLLGNVLRSNIITLDRFFSALRKREEEYIYFISLGATPGEARKPFLAEALTAAISPQIASVATMGLVSLPGMMTGQILGGNSPLIAIQYQIMIMIAIFTTALVSSFLGIRFSCSRAFDFCGRLRPGLFAK